MAEEKLRLDKYLWSIRVFKTRNMATLACQNNKVKMNDVICKPSKQVAIGDKYQIRATERKWDIEVTGLLHTRKSYSEAINFYIDHTPIEDRTSTQAQSSAFYTGKRMTKIGRPTKKDRRDLGDWLDSDV